MLPAVLTAVLFACSGVCGQRSAAMLGPLRANATRLLIALAVLACVAWAQQSASLASPALPWLLLSGLVGFGIGDVALFIAYPHLGARLTLLINLCTAPIAGALAEWLMLGERVTGLEAACCLVIITGVVMALGGQVQAPSLATARRARGVLAAFVAGCGQGFGATLSRMAKRLAHDAGEHWTGLGEAFVRVIPGCALAWIVWIVLGRAARGPGADLPGLPRSRWLWVAGAAMFGPILGVSCFQWALSSASSGLVLSITATTPILIIPMVAYVDGERIGPRALVGSFIAVVGVVLVLTAA